MKYILFEKEFETPGGDIFIADLKITTDSDGEIENIEVKSAAVFPSGNFFHRLWWRMKYIVNRFEDHSAFIQTLIDFEYRFVTEWYKKFEQDLHGHIELYVYDWDENIY